MLTSLSSTAFHSRTWLVLFYNTDVKGDFLLVMLLMETRHWIIQILLLLLLLILFSFMFSLQAFLHIFISHDPLLSQLGRCSYGNYQIVLYLLYTNYKLFTLDSYKTAQRHTCLFIYDPYWTICYIVVKHENVYYIFIHNPWKSYYPYEKIMTGWPRKFLEMHITTSLQCSYDATDS